jgi:hypothetical protein
MIAAGTGLWRAQLGHDWRIDRKGEPDETEVEAPYSADRMKPLPKQNTDGRMNPRGIAYLYLSSDEKTACSEVRPWLGALISLSQFRTNRELTLVNCTSDKKRSPFKAFNAPNMEMIPWGHEDFEGVVWGDICEAMSRPVAPDDSSLSYVSTQIIAEFLRHNGADGIAYKSLLSKGGINIALFDVKDADPIRFMLMKSEEISFTFSQTG